MPHTAINLLPEKLTTHKQTNPYILWFNRIGMYILFGFYAVVLLGFTYRFYTEARLARINADIEEKAATVQTAQGVIASLDALRNKYNVLGATIDLITPKSGYLKIIEETIPVPVKMESLNVSDAVILITANASEYGAITQWYKTLKAKEEFALVSLPSLQRTISTTDGSSTITFTLNIGLK